MPVYRTTAYSFKSARHGADLFALRKSGNIYARRYFYPLLSTLPMYRDVPSAAPERLPVATRAAEEILCLPIFPDLGDGDLERIVAVIRGA